MNKNGFWLFCNLIELCNCNMALLDNTILLVISFSFFNSIFNCLFNSKTSLDRAAPTRATSTTFYEALGPTTHFAGKSKVDPANIDIATETHEFAHFITIKDQIKSGYLDDRIEPFWKEMDSLKRKYTKELKPYIQYSFVPKFTNDEKMKVFNEIYLGDYASVNMNEFFAETFTEYKLNSNPSKYAKLAGVIIDKYFKKKK